MTRKHYLIAFWVLLGVTTLASYWNQLAFRYVVPPGYDGIAHAQIMRTILDGNYLQIVTYHSLWHLLTIPFALLFNVPPITALAWVSPVLMITMVASLAFFANRAFGPIAGIAAMVLMTFFSLQPMQTLIDGGYPNILAAGTLLPLAFLWVYQVASTKMRWWYLPSLLLVFIILIWSHHLTTLYALPIAALFGIVMIGRNLLEKKVPLYLVAGAFILLVAGCIGGIWYLLHATPDLSVSRLAAQFVRVDTQWPFFHLISSLYSPDAILPLGLYPRDIGYVVIFGGIFAFAWGTWRAFVTPHHAASRYYVLLVIWATVLFIGSRMESLGFPVRLARDMAIPMILLCAGSLSDLFTIAEKQIPKLKWVVVLIVCAGILYVGRNTLIFRYHIITDPNAQVHHFDVDSQAAAYITNNLPTESRIGLFQESLYVDLFTPKHDIIWITDAAERQALLSFTTPETALAKYDYLYFERRTGKSTPDDNPDLLAYYLDLPILSEVASFTQPEKQVYLFKITPQPAQIAGTE